MIRELLESLAAERRDREQLQNRLDALLQRVYGPRSEKRPPGPTLFDNMALTGDLLESTIIEASSEVESEAARKKHKQGHGRRKLPADLPRQRVEHDLSEAEKRCPCCQTPRVPIGEEISERLDYTPAVLKVIEHVRPKYICRKCAGAIVVTPLPPEPIAKGLAAPGLLAHVMVSKFADHLPLYRQEKIFARSGLELPRSTLCGWLADCAELLRPLYAWMIQVVLESKVIHTDDTPVRQLHPDGPVTGRVWVYWGDGAHPYTVYDATSSRKRDGPQTFLRSFQGYLQADAFGGYDGIYARGVTEVACWAHARRKFVEAESTDARRASEAIARIRMLYEIEERAREMSPAERAALREREAKPALESLQRWLDSLAVDVLPKSPFGQAINYVRNQWEALNVYVSDGDLAIDNNVAERALRGTALGRKNWLFFGSETGGHTAAILMSFIATCQRHELNPWEYLKDVLTRMPACPKNELATLLPDVWAKTKPIVAASTQHE